MERSQFLSPQEMASMTHWRPGRGQMSPILEAIERSREMERALYAQPTDPTVAGYNVSEKLPPHLRPAWRGMGILGEMLAPSAMKDNPGAVGAMTDVASSVPMTKGILAMASLPASLKGIRAFHGSPHSFDRFDLSKIGTGEGAQAYGHGLYFAENEGVAKAYADTLTKNAPWDGKLAVELDNSTLGDGRVLVSGYTKHNPFGGGGTRRERFQIKGIEDEYESSDAAIAALKAKGIIPDKFTSWVDDGSGNLHVSSVRPNMYEVNINAHPDEFLDWDKPLSQQSENVRKAMSPYVQSAAPYEQAPGVWQLGLHSVVFDKPSNSYLLTKGNKIQGRYKSLDAAVEGSGEDASGAQLYESARLIPGAYRDPVAASEKLKGAGIPGIKYLDQGSRASGDGSRNYVVFDDKLIDILRKYGIAPLAVGGAMLNSSPWEE